MCLAPSWCWLALVRTFFAHAAEHDFDRFHGELASVARGYAEVGDVEQHVANRATARAHEVLVGMFDVGIDPDAPGADVEQLDLTHLLEVMDRLVDGLARDGGHLGAGGLEQRFDRRVRAHAVEQAEDRLALRRDPQSLVPEPGGELVDRLHGDQVINTCCQLTPRGYCRRSRAGVRSRQCPAMATVDSSPAPSRRARRPRHPRLDRSVVLFLGTGIAATLLELFVTRFGIKITTDSATYLGVADNL